MQGDGPSVATGLLVVQQGGCLSPRVRDFLCLSETPRSVLGGEGATEVTPFSLLRHDRIHEAVQQVRAALCWRLLAGGGRLRAAALIVGQPGLETPAAARRASSTPLPYGWTPRLSRPGRGAFRPPLSERRTVLPP